MCGAKRCDKPNCTWGEKHRKECEARTVMRWDKVRRTDYYAKVTALRGQESAQQLKDEVNRQWYIAQKSPTRPQQADLL